ncbi:VOC family protein [Mesorhizobium koreense]|uniref:VOC family protein n=1 Tax=Mesorhizobium koreense TaxID=3074855 RepID=UPI00287B8E3E|nr:VOC family protein [Mesorhizobium sp. WR6]
MPLTAVRAGAYLHHVAFESSNPRQLADFYASAMDMVAEQTGEDEWRCSGPNRRFVVRRGTDRKLSYAGLACRDSDGLEELKARARSEGLDILADPSPYFQDGAFAVRGPDDQIIVFGVAKADTVVRKGLQGPTQHLTFATFDVEAFEAFFHGKLGFALSDRVLHADGTLATSFVRSNHEHHTLACFKSNRQGVDHHSYEAGDWNVIRDWCDRFASLGISLMWGPGRHGPGNNLFIFIEDPDGNWIEISAELEVVHDRPVKNWPQEARTLNLWGKAILRS